MNLAAFANAAWLASSLPAWTRFRQTLRRPEQAQSERLRDLIRANRHSAFGKAHHFDGIRGWEDFCERVPVTGPDRLEPWVGRIRGGESEVLTREPVTRLVPTSGSTGGRKLIPYTAAFQGELNAAIGPWMVDLARQFPGVVAGPAYWSISPSVDSSGGDSAVPVGFDDDSAYLGGWRQRCVDMLMAVPSALRLAPTVEDLRYLTLLCLLRQPGLRLMSVWHPSFLTLLLEALPGHWDELLQDIKRGGCRRAGHLPELLRHALAAGPNARRAAELKHLGPADPTALWPQWRLVSCWADAQAVLPARDLERRLPGVIIQSKGLLATEAVVTIPFEGKHPIALRSHFYEFVDSTGRVSRAHELRLGETYQVVVTTGAGLWRYALGDRVEVDGFLGATPSLRFVGRDNRVSDVCGEKLEEAFVTQALQAACLACGLAPSFAMLAPERKPDRGWHYTLFLEGASDDPLISCLERELRANPHYAWCRDLGQLGPVTLCLLHDGAYERFCAELMREGAGCRAGDVKPQNLSSRSDWRRVLLGVGVD